MCLLNVFKFVRFELRVSYLPLAYSKRRVIKFFLVLLKK